ncbi:unnamed protein product, partial [Mesorhabditis spiculigera]
MYEENEDCRKRNIEKRRETSRFAARDRRGKEADIFQDLKDEVPIVHDATVTHVDRIALLRVAATFCRLRKCGTEVLRTALGKEPSDGPWNEETLLECLDGFLLLVDSDGTILYTSESVILYLGLTQTDLTGRNMRDFMQSVDFDEFARVSAEMAGLEDRAVGEQIVLRMKTVISPRGRNLNLKGALYKPVSFLVRVMHSDGNAISILQGSTTPAGQGSPSATANALTKNGEPQNGTFMTRHTSDMRISYVSDTFNFILKNDSRSLMGASFYELVHPSDAHIVHKSMRELFAKGHVRTPFYRLVAANNNLAWVMTDATTINHTTRGQKGQYVICLHHVLGVQGQDESLVISTDSQPAGIPVLKAIKTELDEDCVVKELTHRQPAVIECIDFTPLLPIPEQSVKSPGVSKPLPSPDSEKTPYDDVLQWLFRDRPSSPAPPYREGHENGPPISVGNCQMAPAAILPNRRKHPRSGDDFAEPQSRPRTESFGRADRRGDIISNCGVVPFSPLADGFSSQCALRSPTSAPSPINPQTTPLPPREQRRSLLPIMPIAGDERINGRAENTAATPLNTYIPSQLLINKALEDLDFPFEDLHSVAPFVPQEELQPISDSVATDFQTLFPDLPDWTSQNTAIESAGRPGSAQPPLIGSAPIDDPLRAKRSGAYYEAPPLPPNFHRTPADYPSQLRAAIAKWFPVYAADDSAVYSGRMEPDERLL